jgi:hypothetical protein
MMNAKVPRRQEEAETFLPLPLRERAGVRGKHGESIAQVTPTDRSRNTPHPNPLPQGERGPHLSKSE